MNISDLLTKTAQLLETQTMEGLIPLYGEAFAPFLE